MRKLGFVLALLASPAVATEMTIEVEGEGANGTVTIDLLEDVAPGHVAQISALAQDGAYDGVVFHRVIEGFMAQTGDVKFGKMGMDMRRAGTGASDRPNLKAEFSDVPFDRGVVGMARSQSQTAPTASSSSCLTKAISSTGSIPLLAASLAAWMWSTRSSAATSVPVPSPVSLT